LEVSVEIWSSESETMTRAKTHFDWLRVVLQRKLRMVSESRTTKDAKYKTKYKFETRNPKQFQNRQTLENSKQARFGFCNWDLRFEFVLDFDIRISDFDSLASLRLYSGQAWGV